MGSGWLSIDHTGARDNAGARRHRDIVGKRSHLADARLGADHGQAVAAIALAFGVGWRSRRWWTVFLPIAAVLGAATAYGTHWYIRDRGLSEDPAPATLWLWIALGGAAAALLCLGWRDSRAWRRAATLASVPLCLLSAALTLNLWVGYFPTVQSAWSQLTSGPLPDQADRAAVTAMAARGNLPPHGSVVAVTIPSTASHFKHRDELVYLPPAWFATQPPRRCRR